MKTEKLDMLFQIAMEELAIEELEFCNSIDRKPLLVGERIQQRIYRSIRLHKVKTACITGLNVLKKVAVACLIVISVAFSAAMCIEPIRSAFVEAVVTWYEDHIGFYFESEEASDGDIKAMPMPTYLPEGWSIESQKENAAMNTCNMFGPNGEIIFYQRTLDIHDELWVDNNTEQVETLSFSDGTIVYLTYYSDDNIYILVWSKGLCSLQLTSINVERELFLKIAESIK